MQAAGLQCLQLQIAAASPDPQNRAFPGTEASQEVRGAPKSPYDDSSQTNSLRSETSTSAAGRRDNRLSYCYSLITYSIIIIYLLLLLLLLLLNIMLLLSLVRRAGPCPGSSRARLSISDCFRGSYRARLFSRLLSRSVIYPCPGSSRARLSISEMCFFLGLNRPLLIIMKSCPAEYADIF